MLKSGKSEIPKILIIFFLFLFIPSQTFTGQKAKIVINASNFKNDKGTARFSLFSQSKGFPEKYKFANATVSAPIVNNNATATFENILYGEYAVSILHDENDNYKMDFNFIGIPKEGFGVSNNRNKKSKPSYDKSKININGNLTLYIDIVYFD
ncbi:MAG: DUF2141 domain-containing protein [Endomicrobiaceae bacterium]|nr:DUF2141 domain-containing protein [Endomicrobiaceae bacterium]